MRWYFRNLIKSLDSNHGLTLNQRTSVFFPLLYTVIRSCDWNSNLLLIYQIHINQSQHSSEILTVMWLVERWAEGWNCIIALKRSTCPRRWLKREQKKINLIITHWFSLFFLYRNKLSSRWLFNSSNWFSIQFKNFQRVPLVFVSKDLNVNSTWKYCCVEKPMSYFLFKEAFWKLVTCNDMSEASYHAKLAQLPEMSENRCELWFNCWGLQISWLT